MHVYIYICCIYTVYRVCKHEQTVAYNLYFRDTQLAFHFYKMTGGQGPNLHTDIVVWQTISCILLHFYAPNVGNVFICGKENAKFRHQKMC